MYSIKAYTHNTYKFCSMLVRTLTLALRCLNIRVTAGPTLEDSGPLRLSGEQEELPGLCRARLPLLIGHMDLTLTKQTQSAAIRLGVSKHGGQEIEQTH